MERISRKLTQKVSDKAIEEGVAELLKSYLPIAAEIELNLVHRSEKEKEGNWLAIMIRMKKH